MPFIHRIAIFLPFSGCFDLFHPSIILQKREKNIRKSPLSHRAYRHQIIVTDIPAFLSEIRHLLFRGIDTFLVHTWHTLHYFVFPYGVFQEEAGIPRLYAAIIWDWYLKSEHLFGLCWGRDKKWTTWQTSRLQNGGTVIGLFLFLCLQNTHICLQ